MNEIVIKNDAFRLEISGDCRVKSLITLPNGEECVRSDSSCALFSVTQARPFNNEVKLAHPNKRTVWQARSVRREGDELHVAFDIVPVKAVIKVTEAADYIAFTLKGFEVLPEDYDYLAMDTPPVEELRLCALPVIPRKNFGEWLNIMWDERAAVAVIGGAPAVRIDSEKREYSRILTADVIRDGGMTGRSAILFACRPEKTLDVLEHIEDAFDIPKGAASRRDPMLNASVYWTADICPGNVDEHIARAKQGGFRLMLIYYSAICREERGYSLCGNYDYNDRYPRGAEDVKYVLAKIKAAGITPGMHFLQTHIGLCSRYVTPKADRRLNKTRLFTLSRPLEDGDTELFVDQDPTGSVMHPKCRFLQFGSELIGYESYSAEYPYRFKGIKRGAFGTDILPHDAGTIGGILDISEFGATSCYIDQNTDLQDEVAEKIASIYDLGFRFCYMDGSEGTNPPFEYNVPRAQMRVYSRLKEKPLFTEGAAKAHFSWHFQSGGNAFDVFPPEVFKEKIDEFPFEEAPRMRMDLTRLDFGWWAFRLPDENSDGTQADQYEYGAARAAAWDCPATVQASLEGFSLHPRAGDILEVMRRWEHMRANGLITEEMKNELRRDAEHTLIDDGCGGYELIEYHRADTCRDITAYVFEYAGKACAVYWHRRDEAEMILPLKPEDIMIGCNMHGDVCMAGNDGGRARIYAGDRRYMITDASMTELEAALKNAVITK